MANQDQDPILRGPHYAVIASSAGRQIIIKNDPKQPTPTEGCPVADGKPTCWAFCGGGWPGTQVTTEKLTWAVATLTVKPENLGCGPLEERARTGLKQASASLDGML